MPLADRRTHAAFAPRTYRDQQCPFCETDLPIQQFVDETQLAANVMEVHALGHGGSWPLSRECPACVWQGCQIRQLSTGQGGFSLAQSSLLAFCFNKIGAHLQNQAFNLACPGN